MNEYRRESSTLSDVSVASSVARSIISTPSKKNSGVGLVTPATVKSNTSALKDALRDKDQYIEQLLKERDLGTPAILFMHSYFLDKLDKTYLNLFFLQINKLILQLYY